jgi:hypothetical protein
LPSERLHELLAEYGRDLVGEARAAARFYPVRTMVLRAIVHFLGVLAALKGEVASGGRSPPGWFETALDPGQRPLQPDELDLASHRRIVANKARWRGVGERPLARPARSW